MTSSLWILVAVFVVLGLAVLFLLMNVFLQQRNAKLTFGVMGAGLFGVSLGWGAFYGGVIMTGQEMAFGVSGFEAETIDVAASEDTAPASAEGAGAGGAGGGMMGGGGMGGGGMGGMMGGMMGGGGGMGGGRGGSRGGSSRRSLTTLVRKLELLTGEVSVKLADKQVKGIGDSLVAAGGSEKMTDEQAKETLEALQGILNDEQKEVLERISLPRRRRGGGGGFGGGRGGARGPQDENPFTEAENAKALVSLLERHGVKAPEIKVKEADQQASGRPESEGSGDTSDGNVIEAILKQHDKDGDGALSKDEAPAFLKNRFDRIDANKDGKCDLKEMTTARRFNPARPTN